MRFEECETGLSMNTKEVDLQILWEVVCTNIPELLELLGNSTISEE